MDLTRASCLRALVTTPPATRCVAKAARERVAQHDAAVAFAARLQAMPVHAASYEEGTCTLMLRQRIKPARRQSVNLTADGRPPLSLAASVNLLAEESPTGDEARERLRDALCEHLDVLDDERMQVGVARPVTEEERATARAAVAAAAKSAAAAKHTDDREPGSSEDGDAAMVLTIRMRREKEHEMPTVKEVRADAAD